MVDVSEYVSGGDFITTDFDNPFKVVILDAPEFVEKTFSDGKTVRQLVCRVSFDEGKEVRKLTINKTNAKALAQVWGNHSERWVGGVVEVGKIRVNVGGERKWGLDLLPVTHPNFAEFEGNEGEGK